MHYLKRQFDVWVGNSEAGDPCPSPGAKDSGVGAGGHQGRGPPSGRRLIMINFSCENCQNKIDSLGSGSGCTGGDNMKIRLLNIGSDLNPPPSPPYSKMLRCIKNASKSPGSSRVKGIRVWEFPPFYLFVLVFFTRSPLLLSLFFATCPFFSPSLREIRCFVDPWGNT